MRRFDGRGRWSRRGLTLVALAMGMAVAAAPPVAAASWSAPITLGVPGNDATSTESDATAASGNVINVLLWNDRSVAHVRSLDAGGSWGGVTILGQRTASTTFRPDGIAASGDRVIAVFSSSTTRGVRKLLARLSVDGGATFGPSSTLASYTSGAHEMGYASVAISGSRAIVAWTDRRNGKVLARRSTDGGASWKPVALVGPTVRPWLGGKEGSVEVAMAGRKVYVGWLPAKSGSDAKGLVVRRSLDGGATWKAPVSLTTKTVDFYGPALAASGSTLLVVYTETSGSSTYKPRLARSTDGGASFTKSSVAAPGPRTFDVTLAGKEARLTFLANGLSMKLRASGDGGKTWTGPEEVGGGLGADPNVTISPSATTVVWSVDDEFSADAFSTRRT